MRKPIGTYDAFEQTVSGLGSGGLLLVTGRQGNPMTIGWGTVGTIWGRPVFVVLVRPSRFSFGLLEELPEFTVNVPGEGLKRALGICGSVSGRDTDKIKEAGLTLEKGTHVQVPCIGESVFHYECRVIHKNNVVNADLDPEIISRSYPRGDFHRVYYGEILGVFQAG